MSNIYTVETGKTFHTHTQHHHQWC